MNQFNLATLVNDMAEEAKLPVARKITNSCIAAIFGAVRQHMREQSRLERSEEEAHPTLNGDIINENTRASLDQRNDADEYVRGKESAEQYTKDLGYNVNESANERAEKMHGVYLWANALCRTLASNPYEEPLSPEGMLKFMIDRTDIPNDTILKAWADATGLTLEQIKSVKMKMVEDERNALVRDKAEILYTFHGYNVPPKIALSDPNYDTIMSLRAEGYDGEAAISALAPLQQHQLSLKALSGMIEAYHAVLKNAMRRNTMELAAMPIILAEINMFVPLLRTFEDSISEDLETARAANRRVNSIDDFRSQLRGLPRPATA